MKKNELVGLAEKLQDAIRDYDGIEFPSVDLNSVETDKDSDSIYVVIGKLPGTDHDIEVWFDGGSGWGERKFWYGFGSYNQIVMSGLAEIGKDDFGDAGRMLTEKDNQHPLDDDGFGKPILEGTLTPKEDRCFWYGVFLEKSPAVDGSEIKRAKTFISTMARKFVDHQSEVAGNVEASNSGFIEGEERKRVVEHSRREYWERDSKAAKDAKANADYKCEACHTRMEDRYGEIGKEYAEAHHLIPLATLKAKKVKIGEGDLKCLCPNCHRMIHRLIGKGKLDGPEAFEELKKRVGS